MNKTMTNNNAADADADADADEFPDTIIMNSIIIIDSIHKNRNKNIRIGIGIWLSMTTIPNKNTY